MPDRTGQDRTGQNRANISRTEQNRTEQNRTKLFTQSQIDLFCEELCGMEKWGYREGTNGELRFSPLQ